MISNISISKSLSGLGLGGIVTQQLSASVYADYSFSAGASVIVVGFDGLPTFYIDGENRTEDTVNITAYDRCRKLSQPFDYSAVSGEIAASLICGAVANQCGFSGVSNTGELLIENVSESLYKGNSCNGIIENLASASGCFVCCDSSDNLRFQKIGSGFSSAAAVDHSSIIEYPQSSYSRLIVSGNKSETYDIGSGAAENIIELSNTMITKSAAEALAAKIFENGSFRYSPVSMNAVIMGNIDPYGAVIVGDDSYTVTNISINLCADGAVASLSAPQMPESSSVYNSLLKRQIDRKIAANKTYGNTEIDSDSGLEFVCGDSENEEKYGFKTMAGGIAEFGGAMLSALQPVGKIEDTADNVVSFLGTLGEKTFRWKCSEDSDGTISLSREEVVSSG